MANKPVAAGSRPAPAVAAPASPAHVSRVRTTVKAADTPTTKPAPTPVKKAAATPAVKAPPPKAAAKPVAKAATRKAQATLPDNGKTPYSRLSTADKFARQLATKVTGAAAAATVATRKLFALPDYARPTAGASLFAHSIAAIQCLGLAEPGKKARESALQALMGRRAVVYHVKQGNLKEEGEYVTLTVAGKNHFASRVAEGKTTKELCDDFLAMFSTGKVSAGLGVEPKAVTPITVAV